MKQIVPDVYLIEGLRGANVYLLTSDEGLTLVDSGTGGDADRIAAQMTEAGFGLVHLKSIVLTHAHSDHTGGLAELVRRSSAEVLAHEDDAPYIDKTLSLPFGSWVQRAMFRVFDLLQPTEACEVDQALQDGDTIEALGGLQVLHLPGHTPGNIALYHPERQIAFCGDTLFHGGPMGRGERVVLPPRIVCIDTAQARASARKLVDLPLQVVCFGHGPPILEGAREKLEEAFA